jgi:hypothetical protein
MEKGSKEAVLFSQRKNETSEWLKTKLILDIAIVFVHCNETYRNQICIIARPRYNKLF